MTSSALMAPPEDHAATASPLASAEDLRTALPLLTGIYQQRRSGVLRMQTGLSVRLAFADGALYLPSDYLPVEYLPARRLAGLLEPEEHRTLPRKAQPEVKALLEHLADNLRACTTGELTFSDAADEVDLQQMVGPLPTACLVMRLAVSGDEDEQVLRQRLGGAEAWLQAAGDADELASAFWLDPPSGFLLARLERPAALSTLPRETGLTATEALPRLCRLHAVGWICGAEAAQQTTTGARREAGEVKTKLADKAAENPVPKVAVPLPQRLLERIGRELEQKPTTLRAEDHRTKLKELLARGGGLDHYRLLDVPLSANDVHVREAFERLARLVHPSHARRLGMPQESSALARLFEQATEAYRVLSSPTRRREYNRQPGLLQGMNDEPESAEKERLLAQDHVERARRMIAVENFHQAHELLNEAVRQDPRADTYMLLGEVQMRNPNWLRRAGESLEEALRRDPQGKRIRLVDVHLDLGEVYSGMRQREEARRHYQAVLELDPKHAEAKVALERLART